MKKGNGTGTIRQRSNGKWEGQYWYSGKRKSVYGNSAEEVRAKLNDVLAKVMTDTYRENSGMLLQEWIEKWLKDYAQPTVRLSTYTSYKGYCEKHIIPILGKKKLRDLTTDLMQEFFNIKSKTGRLDGKEGGLSPKTLSNMRNMLNLVFTQAVVNQLIVSNPLVGVKLPKKKKKEMRVLTQAEQTALEEVIAASMNPQGLGIIIALYTGMRLGEILGLQWSDVDFDYSMSIKVRRSLSRQTKPQNCVPDYEVISEGDKTAVMLGEVKTDKGNRTIYLTDKAIYALRCLQAYQQEMIRTFGKDFNPGKFVICNDHGNPIEPRTYMDIFYGYVKAAGITHANFHSTRHTFATRALELGMDLNTLADTLGHAQPSTTLNMYGHSLDEQKRKEMDKFNKKPEGQNMTAVYFGGTERRLQLI